eukprot:GHVH01010325.1.p1 GENE.GHVH01010325.1~~GHVH01010325.1.p1  ORF type:complete len:151 (+),score=12.19 GHVH01010325.1:55-507(+)
MNNLIPAIRIIRALVGLVYPVCASAVAVYGFDKRRDANNSECPAVSMCFPQLSSEAALSQWPVYWCLFVLLNTWEWAITQMFFLVSIDIKDVFPLYYEISTAFLLWLVHPKYCGALYLWETQFESQFKEAKESLQLVWDKAFPSKEKKDD